MNDFLLDMTAKTLFAGGDIHTGNAEEQNKQLLLVCDKLSYKEYPIACVGANTFLEGNETASLSREVRQQFIEDGMRVGLLRVEGSKIRINASY
jgi:hypothetical protein